VDPAAAAAARAQWLHWPTDECGPVIRPLAVSIRHFQFKRRGRYQTIVSVAVYRCSDRQLNERHCVGDDFIHPSIPYSLFVSPRWYGLRYHALAVAYYRATLIDEVVSSVVIARAAAPSLPTVDYRSSSFVNQLLCRFAEQQPSISSVSLSLSLWLKIHALQRRVLKHTYIHTYTHKPKAKPKASWKSHELCFCMYTVFQHTFQSSDIIFSSFSSFSMRLNAFQRCQVLPLVGFTAEVYARIGALFDRWCIWFNWCETWQWNAKHQLYSAPGCMVGLGNPKS